MDNNQPRDIQSAKKKIPGREARGVVRRGKGESEAGLIASMVDDPASISGGSRYIMSKVDKSGTWFQPGKKNWASTLVTLRNSSSENSCDSSNKRSRAVFVP